MSEFIPGRGINPGKGLLSLAVKICRDEPNTGKIGLGFPRAYNWTPLTEGLFSQRIEVRDAKVADGYDPFDIVQANFIISGYDEESILVDRQNLPELERDPGAVTFFRRFHRIYFEHAHGRCGEAERMYEIVSRGETPLVAQRALDGEVLRIF